MRLKLHAVCFRVKALCVKRHTPLCFCFIYVLVLFYFSYFGNPYPQPPWKRSPLSINTESNIFLNSGRSEWTKGNHSVYACWGGGRKHFHISLSAYFMKINCWRGDKCGEFALVAFKSKWPFAAPKFAKKKNPSSPSPSFSSPYK